VVAAAEELLRYCQDLSRENEHAALLLHELRQINGQLNAELKRAREEMAHSRRDQDALKQELHTLRLQQIMELPAKVRVCCPVLMVMRRSVVWC
jgi:predicted nuclease with TOPRIM domain